MSVATLSPLPDSSSVTMAKSHYLSRRLAKERTVCPRCDKAMQVGTLAWSHRCRVARHVPEDVVQQRLDRMRESAVKRFQQRRAPNAELDCPMEAASLEDPAVVKAPVDGAGNIAAEASQEGQ